MTSRFATPVPAADGLFNDRANIMDEQEQAALVEDLSWAATKQDRQERLVLMGLVALSFLVYTFAVDLPERYLLTRPIAQGLQCFSFALCLGSLLGELIELHSDGRWLLQTPLQSLRVRVASFDSLLRWMQLVCRFLSDRFGIGLVVSSVCCAIAGPSGPTAVGMLAWMISWYPLLVVWIVWFTRRAMMETKASVGELRALQYKLKGV